jgi:hypothetical protein
MGWLSPLVLGSLGAGVALLAAFALIETRVANGREPNRSDSSPETGPASRNPAVSGSM